MRFSVRDELVAIVTTRPFYNTPPLKPRAATASHAQIPRAPASTDSRALHAIHAGHLGLLYRGFSVGEVH